MGSQAVMGQDSIPSQPIPEHPGVSSRSGPHIAYYERLRKYQLFLLVYPPLSTNPFPPLHRNAEASTQ